MGGGHAGDGLAVYFNQNGGAWPANSYPAAEINGSNGYIFTVTSPAALATGDVNKSGYSGTIVGVPSDSGNTGKAYVIFGQSSTYTWPHSGVLTSGDLTGGSTGVIIPGVNSGDKLGTAIAVGDLTGDGINDFAVSAPYASPVDGANGGSAAGSVYVIYGKTKGWSSTLDLSGL